MSQQSLSHLALVFDFGGVLINWDPRFLYRKLFNGDEEAMERFLAEIHFMEWNQNQDAGRPFAEAVAEHCQRYPAYCNLIRAYDERYLESLTEPIWPTVEILRLVKQAGYPLYALSNWPQEKFVLVRPKYEFFDWFDDMVISGAVGLAKPDPKIFHLLLERMGRPASECLIIDDSEKNIAVARQLGFQTIHHQSPEKLRQELVRLGILTN